VRFVFGFKNTPGRRTARGRQAGSLARLVSILVSYAGGATKKLESLTLLCAFAMQTGTPSHYHCKEIVTILSMGAESTTASSVFLGRAECSTTKYT
jgi:hypothetical protein